MAVYILSPLNNNKYQYKAKLNTGNEFPLF